MIAPELVHNLTLERLKQFRRFDMDCGNLECSQCPLGLVPTEVRLRSGRDFTYRCATAYASFLSRGGVK